MNANEYVEIIVDRTIRNSLEWFKSHFLRRARFNFSSRLIKVWSNDWVGSEVFIIRYGQEFFPYHTTTDPNYRVFHKQDISAGAERGNLRFPTAIETLMLAVQQPSIFQAGRRVIVPLHDADGFLLLTKGEAGEVVFSHLQTEEADIQDFVLLVMNQQAREMTGEWNAIGCPVTWEEWMEAKVEDTISDAIENDWLVVKVDKMEDRVDMTVQCLWDKRLLSFRVERPLEGMMDKTFVFELKGQQYVPNTLFNHRDVLVVEKAV